MQNLINDIVIAVGGGSVVVTANYVRENTIIITRDNMPVDIKAVRLKRKRSSDSTS